MKKRRTMKPRATGSTALVPRVIQRAHPEVTKCIDATEPIVIDVTEADGHDGVSFDFGHCALARALCRQYGLDHALVYKRVVYTVKGRTATRYGTNERVRQEIASYDRHHDFEPGALILRPKRPSERLGAPDRHSGSRHDPRPRHDASQPRWIRTPRVRDITMADAVDAVPVKKKKARR